MGKKTKGINNKNQGGIDFIRAKKKVGRKIKKAANATDTTVRAKRITLPGQVLGAEGKGAAVTQRGLSLPELLGQCAHYSERVRKDALDGIADSSRPTPRRSSRRRRRSWRRWRSASSTARRSRATPRRRPRARRPPRPRPARPRAFAPALILHVGAALTRPPRRRATRRGALDAILDVAPDLVARQRPGRDPQAPRRAPRRGDDAASSALVAETDKARAENATSDDRDDYGARSDARAASLARSGT